MAQDDTVGYIVMQYSGRGMAPDRADFEDKVKAEKAFTDAKNAAILWQTRPVTSGLGWIKMKEKEAPPPAAAPAPGAAKPAVPAVAAAGAKPAIPAAPKPAAPAAPVAAAKPPAPAPAAPATPPAAEAKPEIGKSSP